MVVTVDLDVFIDYVFDIIDTDNLLVKDFMIDIEETILVFFWLDDYAKAIGHIYKAMVYLDVFEVFCFFENVR